MNQSRLRLPAALFAGLLMLGTAACDDSSGYDGCHGEGCLVDNPDSGGQLEPRPQFDSQGEPKFDTHGNYIGCHGIGCDVDDPDA